MVKTTNQNIQWDGIGVFFMAQLMLVDSGDQIGMSKVQRLAI